jgi:hypothetical protein
VRCPHLELAFPKLYAAGYDKTSERTDIPPTPGAYNCIAWAAHDSWNWWWPTGNDYWPFLANRANSIPCFIKAFRLLGYRVCADSRREFGFEKVVLYAINKVPKHMARQLRDGTWTSKCGGEEDITHYTLDALETQNLYGSPELYMRRLIFVSWVIRFAQILIHKIKKVTFS